MSVNVSKAHVYSLHVQQPAVTLSKYSVSTLLATQPGISLSKYAVHTLLAEPVKVSTTKFTVYTLLKHRPPPPYIEEKDLMSVSTAIDASAVARVVGIKTEFEGLRNGNIFMLPQRIALIGQGASNAVYATTKRQVTSAVEVATLYGYGSPLHLAALQFFPVNGDGVNTIPVTVYPLNDDASGVASTGDIVPVGAQTVAASYRISVNNILSEPFVISVGDSLATIVTNMAAAINAVLEMPVTAVADTTVASESCDVTSKWKGSSANDIQIEVIGSTSAGTTFTVTNPTGGLVNPNIDSALAQVGDVWETLVLNCLNIDDTVSLDKYQTFGDGRWGALTRKPLVVFTGNTTTAVNDATTISDARKTDRVNVQLVAPGSKNLPFVVAARQLARIVVLAGVNPAHDYGRQSATGLIPGDDGDQWTYVDQDVAVKKGSSTVNVTDGVVTVADVVTFYHPDGDPLPAYRHVVDIVKLANIIFNIDLIFNTKEWDGAPLIPDNQPTTNRDAKKPMMAKAVIGVMLDNLAMAALISDPESSKQGTLTEINSQNPKRLDIMIPIKLSGNTNIISIDLGFKFFFGAPAVAA